MYYFKTKQEQMKNRIYFMKTSKFDNILDDIDYFFLQDGYKDSPIPLFTALIGLAAVILCCYYDKPELENYNLKEKLPAPQNEVVVNDRDIAAAVKHQKEVAADFNRMYNKLQGREKRNWASQPVDTLGWYGKTHQYPNGVHTLKDFDRYIYSYEKFLTQDAHVRARTKYKNYKGK